MSKKAQSELSDSEREQQEQAQYDTEQEQREQIIQSALLRPALAAEAQQALVLRDIAEQTRSEALAVDAGRLQAASARSKVHAKYPQDDTSAIAVLARSAAHDTVVSWINATEQASEACYIASEAYHTTLARLAARMDSER